MVTIPHIIDKVMEKSRNWPGSQPKKDLRRTLNLEDEIGDLICKQLRKPLASQKD
jgi:hypothetical protein